MSESDVGKIDPKSANQLILEQLRTEFESMTVRLTPELEPAVSYDLLPERTK